MSTLPKLVFSIMGDEFNFVCLNGLILALGVTALTPFSDILKYTFLTLAIIKISSMPVCVDCSMLKAGRCVDFPSARISMDLCLLIGVSILMSSLGSLGVEPEKILLVIPESPKPTPDDEFPLLSYKTTQDYFNNLWTLFGCRLLILFTDGVCGNGQVLNTLRYLSPENEGESRKLNTVTIN